MAIGLKNGKKIRVTKSEMMKSDENPSLLKSIAVKGIRLERYLNEYHSGDKKQDTMHKFINVWGKDLAEHFLSKYDNAESLIYALDENNLDLFIEKF